MLVDCKKCLEIDISKNIYSQKGEELIIENIFNDLKISKGFCVEFGAYDGTIVSNTKKLRNNGWNACLVDCDFFSPEVDVYRLNKNNINHYFSSKSVPKFFELLSVDVDGIDIFLIDEMLKIFSPKVIVTEFNRFFEKNVSKSVKYDDNFVWEGGTIYYGSSYGAFEKMFKKNGYSIGIVHEQNIYAFMDCIELKNQQTNYLPHSDQLSLKNLENFVDY